MSTFSQLPVPLRVAAATVAIGLLAVITVRWAPPYLVEGGLTGEDYQQALTSARTALIQMLAALSIGGGVWFTAQSYLLNKRTQRTDRFTNAVKLLGDESQTVRLSGVRILTLLARESVYYWDSVDVVLSGFVREVATKGARRTSDVQAAVEAIGQRPKRYRTVDLSNTVLRGAKMEGGNYDYVVFDNSDLSGANFNDASLTNASFRGATMTDCNLIKAKLTGVSFAKARLRGSDFFEAKLRGCDFSDADVHGVDHLPPAT